MEEFFRGVVDGASSPFTIFSQEDLRRLPNATKGSSSYRGLSADRENIQRDFNKAVAHVTQNKFKSKSATR